MSEGEDSTYVIVARADPWQVEEQEGYYYILNTTTNLDIPTTFGTIPGALYYLEHILKVPPSQVQRLIDTAPMEGEP